MHLCHAHGCRVEVAPHLLMCLRHWRMVPAELQRRIWKEYRRGQEERKDPSDRYMAIQQRAIAAVAFKPNDELAARTSAAYLLRSEHFRRKAIDAGAGDPCVGLP